MHSAGHLVRFVAAGAMLLAIGVGFPQASTPASESAPDTLTGTYIRTHTIVLFTEEGADSAAVVDSLTLRRGDDGHVDLSLHLSHDNGHTCWLGGVAERREDYLEYLDTLSVSPYVQVCRLRLCVEGDEVVLDDVGRLCRLTHCGVRGYFGGLRFTRAPSGD